MSWASAADRVLGETFRALPPGATEEEVERAVRDAYPFGAREYWPYKVWLKRAAAWKAGRKAGLHGPLNTRATPGQGRRRTRDPNQGRLL